MGESPSESAWEVTAARYVAYFDIMGFKDMVLRISHNEIYEMMKKIGIRIKAPQKYTMARLTQRTYKNY